MNGGGKPPFPTFETFMLESLAFKHECLTGQEGLLCPRSVEIHFYLNLFCNLVLQRFLALSGANFM
jgi:hypothetical protein